MEKQTEENAVNKASCAASGRNTEKKTYAAPQAEVIEVCVEQGFAVTTPGFGDGGDI